MKFRKSHLIFLLIFCLGASSSYARKAKYQMTRPLTPAQLALVRKAIAQEKIIIANIQQRTPLVETYIQDTKPDPNLYEVPVGDDYMLSRVDFGRAFFDKVYEPRATGSRGFFKGSLSAMTGLSKLLGLERYTYNPNGFMEMMFVDPTGFDQQHYQFSYVRREFLGSVRTWVFDVHPRTKGMGRFYGRIWIEDQGGNIVRFNGTYTGPKSRDTLKYFFHFDSWRMNLQPGVWLPVAVYVEESHRVSDTNSVGIKAQTHFWGYDLKLPAQNDENVNVTVDNAVDQSGQSQDVGPIQASRMWVTQAEDNVLDRLEQAGLVAPLIPGGYEQKILDQIVINLVVPNNIPLTGQVHCRVLLTDTIETTTVGNSILLSRGLLDSLPNEESIASVIAMELAHIALGHHIDTRYAFNDRLLFPDEAVFQRIDMNHSDQDNQKAAALAMKYMESSMYKDKLASAGLYYVQLEDSGKVLKALNTPKLGDSLLQPDGIPWMDALAKMAPKLEWNNLNQIAALPLGSWLKVNPWNDTVQMLGGKRYAPLNASEKMPFEVTPIFYNLQRYETANATEPAGTTTPANGAQPAPQSGSTAPAPQGQAGAGTSNMQ